MFMCGTSGAHNESYGVISISMLRLRISSASWSGAFLKFKRSRQGSNCPPPEGIVAVVPYMTSFIDTDRASLMEQYPG